LRQARCPVGAVARLRRGAFLRGAELEEAAAALGGGHFAGYPDHIVVGLGHVRRRACFSHHGDVLLCCCVLQYSSIVLVLCLVR